MPARLSLEPAADLLEVIEDRAGRRSTPFASQLPIALRHATLGEPTIADALCDRIRTNLHRIELAGQSMRRRGDSERPMKDAVTTGAES